MKTKASKHSILNTMLLYVLFCIAFVSCIPNNAPQQSVEKLSNKNFLDGKNNASCLFNENNVLKTLVGHPRKAGYRDGLLEDGQLEHPTFVHVTKNEEIIMFESNHQRIRIVKANTLNTIGSFASKSNLLFFSEFFNKMYFSEKDSMHEYAFLTKKTYSKKIINNNENFIGGMHAYQNRLVYMISGDNRYSRSIKHKTIVKYYDNDETLFTFEAKYASGIVFDSLGNAYLLDVVDSKIYKYDQSTKKITTFIGAGDAISKEGPIEKIRLIDPVYITLDPFDDLYVLERTGTIKKIYNNLYVKTIFVNEKIGYEDGKSGYAKMFEPSSISVSRKCAVYIADTRNNAIRVLSSEKRE